MPTIRSSRGCVAALAAAAVALLTVAPSSAAAARSDVPPPGWLAFSATRTHLHARYDIYAVRTDGTGLRRLTFNGNSVDPAWAPGGARILYTRHYHIWIMDTDGRHKHPVDLGPGYSWQPSWAPTGKAFAFVSNRSGTAQLYVYRFATGTVSQLTTATSAKRGPEVADPAWSPRGGRILFSRTYGVFGLFDNPLAHIYAISPRGTGLTRLTYRKHDTYGRGGDDRAPSWGPSGTRFIYTRGWQGDESSVPYTLQFRVQRRDGSIAHQFPSHGEVYPAFSPDGRWVAAIRPKCCSDVSGGPVPAPGLWLMRPDGSSARRIVSYARLEPYSGSLAWKPTPAAR